MTKFETHKNALPFFSVASFLPGVWLTLRPPKPRETRVKWITSTWPPPSSRQSSTVLAGTQKRTPWTPSGPTTSRSSTPTSGPWSGLWPSGPRTPRTANLFATRMTRFAHWRAISYFQPAKFLIFLGKMANFIQNFCLQCIIATIQTIKCSLAKMK